MDILSKLKKLFSPVKPTMAQKISEQILAIERHWAGAWIYLAKNPAKFSEACRVVFESEQKLLKQLLQEGLADKFTHQIAKFKSRNTIQLVIDAVSRHEGPWDAFKPVPPTKK